jgi:hypothetical protein
VALPIANVEMPAFFFIVGGGGEQSSALYVQTFDFFSKDKKTLQKALMRL